MTNPFAEYLRVQLLQVNVNKYVAWRDAKNGDFEMAESEQEAAFDQMRLGFRGVLDHTPRADVVILPELAVPRGYMSDLRRYATSLQCVVIAGTDYKIDLRNRVVANEAVVLMPRGWPSGRRTRSASIAKIGKTYPAHEEQQTLAAAGFRFRSDPVLWLFDTRRFGSFGVSICYDAMDLERCLLYRGKIHHLFVLAYNQDINSFYYLAEALSRTMYCNIVICNTGYYGGSLAIAPYYQPWQRTIYRHEGGGLFAHQVIALPVRSLVAAQQGDVGRLLTPPKASIPLYKRPPPGFTV